MFLSINLLDYEYLQVFDVATGEAVPLTTFSLLPSAHLLRWSRDGFRIFAACPNGGFNIWQGSPVWDAQRYSKSFISRRIRL